MTKDLKLRASVVKIQPFGSYSEVEVSVEDVEIDNILEHLTIEEVVDNLDNDDILDEIGKEKVMDYFNLIEKE